MNRLLDCSGFSVPEIGHNLHRLKRVPVMYTSINHKDNLRDLVKRDIKPGNYFQEAIEIMGDPIYDKQDSRHLRGVLSASTKETTTTKKQFFNTYAELARFLDLHKLERNCFCCFQDCGHYVLGFGDFRTAKRHIYFHCQDLINKFGYIESRILRCFYLEQRYDCTECDFNGFNKCKKHPNSSLKYGYKKRSGPKSGFKGSKVSKGTGKRQNSRPQMGKFNLKIADRMGEYEGPGVIKIEEVLDSIKLEEVGEHQIKEEDDYDEDEKPVIVDEEQKEDGEEVELEQTQKEQNKKEQESDHEYEHEQESESSISSMSSQSLDYHFRINESQESFEAEEKGYITNITSFKSVQYFLPDYEENPSSSAWACDPDNSSSSSCSSIFSHFSGME